MQTPMRTPLKQARGLGTTSGGAVHFWRQRITGLANVPLTVFFLFSMVFLAGADHAAVVSYFSHPIPALLMMLFVIASAWHMMLGFQVIIEDYIHHEGMKVLALVGNILFTAFFGLTCIFAIVKLSLGG
ncbi:MAG: succinate dehydrogenase, hydrophobic membrane anchor protein [Hyphomicrobiales bacterium]|nr:MAG: succinate dehydrogenase, hydrophobic membrane anchor protein [Hyphomicrobiales bacterium]